MMLLPFSKRRTMPRMSSPLRSLYSLKMRSRSASRTRWRSTCFAVCAAMRPKVAARLLQLEEVAELLVLLARLLGVFGAPEDLEAELLAELGVEAVLLGVVERDLALGLGHLLDDGHVLEEVDLAGVLVEARLELAGRPEDALRGLQDGRLDRLDEDLLVDPLLLRDLLEDAPEARVRRSAQLPSLPWLLLLS